MRSSENISDLAAALWKAQALITQPTKDKTAKVKTKAGYDYSFNYVSLDGVLDVIRKPFADAGLCFVQGINGGDDRPALTTRIMHSGGQWIESDYPLNFSGSPQERGSELTYAKRYALCAMLGIAAEEDDDGNRGSGNGASVTPRNQPKQPQRQSPPAKPQAVRGEVASAEQVREVSALLADREDWEALTNKWFAAAGVTRWEDMPADKAAKCIERLKKPQAAATGRAA